MWRKDNGNTQQGGPTEDVNDPDFSRYWEVRLGAEVLSFTIHISFMGGEVDAECEAQDLCLAGGD
jgi:hypothetical protein